MTLQPVPWRPGTRWRRWLAALLALSLLAVSTAVWRARHRRAADLEELATRLNAASLLATDALTLLAADAGSSSPDSRTKLLSLFEQLSPAKAAVQQVSRDYGGLDFELFQGLWGAEQAAFALANLPPEGLQSPEGRRLLTDIGDDLFASAAELDTMARHVPPTRRALVRELQQHVIIVQRGPDFVVRSSQLWNAWKPAR